MNEQMERMERVELITKRINPDQLAEEETSLPRLGKQLGISESEMETRRKVLAKILLDDRLAHNFDIDAPEDTDLIVQSILPITRSIPLEYLYESYVRAMELRPVGNTYQIKGVEMVGAWREIQGQLEMESVSGLAHNQKLLPERAAAACPRCVKETDPQTKTTHCREVMPDGSIGGPCDHRPLTEEEMKEAARIKADNLAWAKREADRIREQRRKFEQKEEKPRFVNIRMECSSCHRRVDSDGVGWKDGDACGAVLKGGDASYTIPTLCEGQLFAIKK